MEPSSCCCCCWDMKSAWNRNICFKSATEWQLFFLLLSIQLLLLHEWFSMLLHHICEALPSWDMPCYRIYSSTVCSSFHFIIWRLHTCMPWIHTETRAFTIFSFERVLLLRATCYATCWGQRVSSEHKKERQEWESETIWLRPVCLMLLHIDEIEMSMLLWRVQRGETVRSLYLLSERLVISFHERETCLPFFHWREKAWSYCLHIHTCHAMPQEHADIFMRHMPYMLLLTGCCCCCHATHTEKDSAESQMRPYSFPSPSQKPAMPHAAWPLAAAAIVYCWRPRRCHSHYIIVWACLFPPPPLARPPSLAKSYIHYSLSQNEQPFGLLFLPPQQVFQFVSSVEHETHWWKE